MRKRFLSIMLTICMVLTLVPQVGFAAAGTSSTPSVSAYATKEQLMDGTFAPKADGTATNIGKLVFGKNSSGKAQEWYILGKDTGVTGDNTIIFAASPMVTSHVFDGPYSGLDLSGGENKKTDANLKNDCSYNGATPSEVYRNHYGASALRDKLQSIATEKNHFTEAEQNMMNATTVTTKDTKNSANYTTTDKLYALAADGFGDSYKTIKAGSSNQKELAMDSYWKDEKVGFWLRSPGENIKHPLSHDSCFAFYANSGINVMYHTFVTALNVQPASNLNLSNVLFASAATAATSSNSEASGKIASGTAMTLRLDGSSKNIGSAIYNTTTGDIKATKGSTERTVSLVVQGKCGTDDWYYSKQITGTETVNVSDIEAEPNTPASIDLSACKIWLEFFNASDNHQSRDGMIYAVNAEKEIEKINTTYATKEQLMNSFRPYGDGSAANVGKLIFGKNSSRNEQEWYILGKDTGVSGDNTIIFAASPIATEQKFNSNAENKTYSYEAGTGYGNTNGSIDVYANHYGASALRSALNDMVKADNKDYFTEAEQSLMNATTVTTTDILNNLTYTITDKLYTLHGVNGETKIYAGSSNQTSLARDSYWNSESEDSWLRSPYVDSYSSSNYVLAADSGESVGISSVRNPFSGGITSGPVRPAGNLNLSNVLFASAATAATSSTEAKFGTIAPGTAMTLRLDGSNKYIGTVTYNAEKGIIEVKRGYTSLPVALIVQGNDGNNDWYYSEKIMVAGETKLMKADDIKSVLKNLSSDIDLSSCKIWLEAFSDPLHGVRGDGMIYAVNATETPITNISSVVITGIEEPMANIALDTEAVCATTGVISATPSVSWTPEHTTAVYNTSYTASVTLTADTFYAFTDSSTATVNGKTASATKNHDGTLTVTFSATAKDKLTSITAPQAITVANGTSYDAMELPETVEIVTEGNAVNSAEVTWNTTNPASGSYDPDKLTEQTVTLNGTVKCPANVDANGVPLTTTITITIREADTVEAPQANLSEGTYTSNQSVELSSSTDGADIYYTTDGTSPSRTNGTKYTGAISVTGKEAQSAPTTIKAIAVKDKMQDSSVETFTYTIQIPDTTAPNAEIKIGLNSWKEFLSSITFDLFFKDTQNVTIIASDNSGEAVRIEYLLCEEALTVDELNEATFTEYDKAFSISPDKKFVIYAKLTDTSDNYRYINSEGLVLDATAPVISGIENGRTYCSAQTVTVTEKYIARVTVNGTEVQLNENNRFTLSAADGAQTIVATDKAGNVSAEMIVTVNDKHIDKNKDHKCDFCGTILFGNSFPLVQKPTIEAGEGVKVTLSADGTVATITVDDGYQLTHVVLNGVSKGKVTEVKNLKTGDKLVVTSSKKPAEPTEPTKEEILALLAEQKLVARSKLVTMKNGKKAVRITWYNKNGEMMEFDGVEIFRSTKRNSGYGKKPIFTSATGKYYNTAVKKGTKYYYKVRGFVIIDGQKYYTDYSLKAIRTVK